MKNERDPSELIDFLNRENVYLKDEVAETKELLKLNKQALAIAVKFRKEESEQALPKLVSLLFQENTKLHQKNSILRKDIENNICQTLICQQIVNASNEHQKYLTSELKDRLILLKKQLDAKDKKITDLMKSTDKEQRENSPSEVCLVEYTDMNKVTTKLYAEFHVIQKELEFKNQEIQRLKDQKDQLIKLNLMITKQANEMKIISCQTTKSNQSGRQFNTSTTDLSKFLKYQRNITDDEQNVCNYEENMEKNSENSEDDEQDISSSDEDHAEEMAPQIQEEIKVEKPSKLALPKLQMKRAKEIQSLIVKKMNADEKKKQGSTVPKDQKSRRIEQECEDLRKKIGEELILKHLVEKENSLLKKFILELQSRNELLVKAKEEKLIEKNYEKVRQIHQGQDLETLLDICRDVTLNNTLKQVCKGKANIEKKIGIYSNQI